MISSEKAMSLMRSGGTAYHTTRGCESLTWCRIHPEHGQQSYSFGVWIRDYYDWTDGVWYEGQRIFNYDHFEETKS